MNLSCCFCTRRLALGLQCVYNADKVIPDGYTWIDGHAHLTDERGHRQVVRNGHADSRTVVTSVGPMDVTMPRVHDRRSPEERERFTSKILPPYLRKAKAIEELIP